MRSVLLVIATLVLIVCGFVIYATMQTPVAQRDPEEAKRPTSVPSVTAGTGDAGNPLGPGKDPWVRRFNEKTAELESQFKAARYERQPDGTVLVDKPVAEFFLGGGRLVRIEGSRGSVVMPGEAVVEEGEVRAPVAAPPSRGQLHDVVISLFDDSPAEDGAAPEPTITVEMNNTSFDNDTFVMTTEAFTDPATNQRVEADQVPVKVRGKDYDFDGRGLRIQWNELNKRLQLLEIAHGESLRVKNRAKFEELQGGEPATKPAEPPRPRGKRNRAVPVAATTPTTKPIVPYRASFEENLRITEGETEIANGSLMQIDFVMDKGDGDSGSAAGVAAGSQAGAISAGRRVAHRPRATTEPTPTPTPTPAPAQGEPTTAPATTQPAAELLPIIVYWTGRLRVMPLELSDEVLGPDDQIIRLAGAPLKLSRDGANIEAAGATFHTADGRASLRSSEDVPRVIMKDASGAVIATPSLAYSDDGGTAILKGPSRADIPIGKDEQKAMLSATWEDECRLALPKDEQGQTYIQHANLTGRVAISHPRIDLNSDALELAFTAPTTRPATQPVETDAKPATRPSTGSQGLEKLIAMGDVIANVKNPTGPPQSLQAGKLEIQTAPTEQGELLPHTITADGNVVLSEPTQSLRAQRVHTTLKPKPTTAPSDTTAGEAPATSPTTKRAAGDIPDLVVESVTAQGDVRLEGKDGAFATAEELEAGERDGQTELVLRGGPKGATVSDGKSTITGPVLKIRPADQIAEIPGGGTLSFVPASKNGQVQEPVDVAWTGHAALDGKLNVVNLHDGITFKSTGADGMATTSQAEHLLIALVDKPTTQPSTQAVGDEATTQPATRPATRPLQGGLADLQNMDFLANKEARAAKLTGDVRIESTLLKDDGTVERRVYMRADEAGYDLVTRQMTVPVPGRLLYEDHRPDEAQKDEQDGPANRGTTAFEWKKQLAYDDSAHRVVMEGDVDINHVPDAQAGESFRIATQRVIADLEPRAAREPTTAPATAPTTDLSSQPTTDASTRPSPVPTAMRLKQITADGGVRVQTKRFEFTGTRVSFSPTTGILTATGSPGDPITLTEDGRVDSTIESLTWNTKTDQITLKGGRGRVRP